MPKISATSVLAHPSGHRFRARPIAATSVAALLCFIGCKQDSENDAAHKPPPVPVAVGVVEQKDVPVVVSAVGTVEPASTVEITAQVTGLVMDVHFKEGDFVKRGDLLFTIDTRPYSSSLASAQAQLQRDQALLEQARIEADRYTKLHQEGVASAQEMTRAQTNASSIEATVAADKASIASASLNVQFAKIQSPLNGRTGSLLVYAGNVVHANDPRPLVVIRALSPAYVRFAVPQEYLSRVRSQFESRPLPVSAVARGDGAKRAEGVLTLIENTVDTATGTISLKGQFPNLNNELWPGEFVDVGLELGIDRAATVAPETAVQQGQQGAFAYVVQDGNKASLRTVQVSRVANGEAVIKAGLKVGEQVVTDGQVRLRDGAQVTIKPSAPTPRGSAEDHGGPPVTGVATTEASR